TALHNLDRKIDELLKGVRPDQFVDLRRKYQELERAAAQGAPRPHNPPHSPSHRESAHPPDPDDEYDDRIYGDRGH
ncbi:MAG: hypothetical protein V1855_04465, partial [bacterium]